MYQIQKKLLQRKVKLILNVTITTIALQSVLVRGDGMGKC